MKNCYLKCLLRYKSHHPLSKLSCKAGTLEMISSCFGISENREVLDARRSSKDIDKKLIQWAKPFQQSIKILLLGAGETGKTTIIKQMKILHINGYSAEEKLAFVDLVRQNLYEAIFAICLNMPCLNPPIAFSNKELEKHLSFVMEHKPPYSLEFFKYVSLMWKDEGVQSCFKRSNEYQLIESAKYFLDRINKISCNNYVPTIQDILHCRKKTTSIQKIEFSMKVSRKYGGGRQSFWMFDVGGQRGERRKWIQVFDGINCVLFLVACSSFDQVIREDNNTNRLRESLNLFEDVWDSRYLRETGFIIFLNKQDVLRQKLKEGKSIEQYFPEFRNYPTKPGEQEIDRVRAFIRDLFLNITREYPLSPLDRRLSLGPGIIITPDTTIDNSRQCYWHYTTAVDTDNIRIVFDDVHSMIISRNLASIGLE